MKYRLSGFFDGVPFFSQLTSAKLDLEKYTISQRELVIYFKKTTWEMFPNYIF